MLFRRVTVADSPKMILWSALRPMSEMISLNGYRSYAVITATFVLPILHPYRDGRSNAGHPLSLTTTANVCSLIKQKNHLPMASR